MRETEKHSSGTVFDCIQCGVCSGSCPLVQDMENTPRQLIGMIVDGERMDIFCGNTIWVCTTCYICSERCPREIPIGDIFYGLRQDAIANNISGPGIRTSSLARKSVNILKRRGRLYEVGLDLRQLVDSSVGEKISDYRLSRGLRHRYGGPTKKKKIRGLKGLRSLIQHCEQRTEEE